MAFEWKQLTITRAFSEAIEFSNKKFETQAIVSADIEDEELAQLRSNFERYGFTIRRTLNEPADLAFHLERNEKRMCGVIVIRKSAISIDLLESVFSFF